MLDTCDNAIKPDNAKLIVAFQSQVCSVKVFACLAWHLPYWLSDLRVCLISQDDEHWAPNNSNSQLGQSWTWPQKLRVSSYIIQMRHIGTLNTLAFIVVMTHRNMEDEKIRFLAVLLRSTISVLQVRPWFLEFRLPGAIYGSGFVVLACSPSFKSTTDVPVVAITKTTACHHVQKVNKDWCQSWIWIIIIDIGMLVLKGTICWQGSFEYWAARLANLQTSK